MCLKQFIDKALLQIYNIANIWEKRLFLILLVVFWGFFRRGCCKLNIEIIYILLHLIFSNNTYTRRFNIFKQYLYIAGLIFSTTKFSISKWTSKWRLLDRPRICPDKVNVLLGHSDRYTLVYVILCTIMHNHTSMPIVSTHIFMPLRTTGWSWLFIDYIILPKAGFNMGGGRGWWSSTFLFSKHFFLNLHMKNWIIM